MTDSMPEKNIAEQREESELDRKLRDAAAKTRGKVEEKRARGEPATLREMVSARTEALVTTQRTVAAAVRVADAVFPEPDHSVERNRLRDALVPARFRTSSLATYDPITRSQTAALKAVQAWLERVRAGESAMLALIGSTGAGKSHLLYAALHALIDDEWNPRQRRPYARPWYRLADELRYGGEHYITGAPIEAAEVRRTFLRARLTLIDEVRVTASTNFDDTELAKWACGIYDECGAALVTTNHAPLEDIFGPPGASRFAQVVIDGPDWRHR